MKIIIHHSVNCFLILLSVAFGSCQNEDYSESIDLTRNDPVSVFDLFTEVEVIQLETHPEGMLGWVGRGEYYEGRYYFLDGRAQQIFCFDEKGNFIFRISAQGKGPGEYTHITDLKIDRKNKNLVVLDAIAQRIMTFDFEGNFIEARRIPTDKVMGLSECFLLNDSLLLLTAWSNEHLVLFNKDRDEVTILDSLFYQQTDLGSFGPGMNVYQHNDRTYALPALSREWYDVTEGHAVPHFEWCFGENNNSPRQIDQLVEETKSRGFNNRFVHHFEAVGKGKILNHHIIRGFENNRFMMAFLEFENDFKHVVIDKKLNKHFVFNNFKEGVGLVFENYQSDRVITFDKPLNEMYLSTGKPELTSRNMKTFNTDLLSEAGREIVQNHDPLKDNLYLIVYKFKE